MMKLGLFIFAFVVGSCLANPPRISSSVTVDYGNANFYVDMILRKVNKALPDYIPIPDIPDAPFGANNCSLLGTKNGIKREGNATVLLVDNTARFTSKFRMEDLGVYCDFKVLLNKGSGSGTTSYVIISSGISWLLERGQHPWLTEFLVTDVDEIVVNVDGFFGLNWLIEDIAGWIANGAEEYIVKIVENDVQYVFQAVLDTIVIP